MVKRGIDSEPSDSVNVDMQLHHETDEAIFVSTDGERSSAIWLPKSEATFTPGATNPRIGHVTLPEWLATKRGLV